MNPDVEAYFKNTKNWSEELKKLRTLLLECGLTEELKWGKPCYTFQGSNVIIILPLKNHCALLFCKGALLNDRHGILIKPGENTQAARQIRLTHVRQIEEMEAILKGYIHQAIDAEKAGLEVNYKKITDFRIPEELQSRLNEVSGLKKAFTSLTPGRQRGYIIYISAPKQSRTRASRVEKCTPRILEGKGLNDR